MNIIMYTSLLVAFQFSLLSFSLSSAQPAPDFHVKLCYSVGNYTNNSLFANNLQALLAQITNASQDTNSNGFYKLTVGADAGGEQANGVAQCRRDVTPSACATCLTNASLKIRDACPNAKEAIGWYDQCMLRYSNASIPVTNESPIVPEFNTSGKAFNPELNQTVNTLLSRLNPEFDVGSADLSDSRKVYALVECRRDLLRSDCSRCVDNIVGIMNLNTKDNETTSAFIVSPSCDVRYQMNQFYSTYLRPGSSSHSPNQGISRLTHLFTLVAIFVVSGIWI